MNRLTKLILAAGILGRFSILIGVQAIGKQIYLESSRYDRRAIETYTWLAAIIQGIIIILLGLLLSTLAVLVYFDAGQSIFFYFVRRPGILLIIIVLYFFLTALSTIIGYVEQKHGPKWNIFLELIVSRLLPGIILIVIALIAISLGVVELAALKYFDKMGGGLLEIFFDPG